MYRWQALTLKYYGTVLVLKWVNCTGSLFMPEGFEEATGYNHGGDRDYRPFIPYG